jgi:K(+)-stimulated pyrophosphate-energized sodium pump
MSEMEPEVRKITDSLDAVGNTTAAIGKGFAIGSALLTSLILIVAFLSAAGLSFETMNLANPSVLIGLFIGAMIPFFFSSLAMDAIYRAAFAMIEEVRRQFRSKPGILEGTEEPDYRRCVDISTRTALKSMILPGVSAILAPILAGLIGGPAVLTGLLVGATVSGGLLAIFMSNAGGAWDNAKKLIESRSVEGKGSGAHRAAVVGDTVGDPFKDTAGPSLNILIKLMAVISLVLAPLLRTMWR